MDVAPNRAAQFHLITRGNCSIHHAGSELRLSAGDIVVFPHGHAHRLYDGVPDQFVDGMAVFEQVVSGKSVFEDGPRVTSEILCGHFEFDHGVPHPLIRGLPDIMVVEGFDSDATGPIAELSALLLSEQQRGLAGSVEIVTRLAESLFIQMLRAYMVRKSTTGFLAALNDQRLSKALQIIHASNTPLTLKGLAKDVGMSRSNLASTFKDVIGQSPMKYWSDWRLLQARRVLEVTRKPISIIAEESGYASEAAFSRAFKMRMGFPPSAIRKQAAESRFQETEL